ncbi:MAG: phytoene desaturase family protein, partial [Persicimonas sp.]
MAIDPLHTMAEAIDKRISSPKLRDVLYRYATYNGSNPFRAPATLNCIAWVELGLGGYGVRGGMYELVRAMERIARRLGVEITYGAPVRRIDTAGGAVEAVVTDQKRHRCEAVVVNADVAHLVDELLGEASSAKIAAPAEPSMSGWTAVARAERRPEEARAPHTVYFPERYGEEFVDIFERRRPPEEPTVYLCAQEKAHDRTGWEREEPLFLMVNAPCEPAEMPRAERAWSELRNRALGRLYEAGLIEKSDAIVWERTPTELAERFPGSRGSIYGAASNSKTAAFKRPPNRVEGVEGLYLASGSAHPGGGVPLCAQSGRLAAKAVASDLA